MIAPGQNGQACTVLHLTAANLAVLAGGKHARIYFARVFVPGQNGQIGCCETQDRADWRAHQLLGRQSPDEYAYPRVYS